MQKEKTRKTELLGYCSSEKPTYISLQIYPVSFSFPLNPSHCLGDHIDLRQEISVLRTRNKIIMIVEDFYSWLQASWLQRQKEI